jgi:quinolinate synthase
VWVDASLGPDGSVQLRAASDSAVTAGLAGVLVSCLSGLSAEAILGLDPADLLPRLGLGPAVMTRSRTQGLANLLEAVQRRTRRLIQDLPQFPSLVIRAGSVEAQGQFAQVQAQYLQPDAQQVSQLVQLLSSKQIGVVAHFYMDPQVRRPVESLVGWLAVQGRAEEGCAR